MSVESEILRIQQNIANAYAAVSEKGGEVPLRPNSANLAAAVGSISVGETSAHIISASYAGTGTVINTIEVGFRPKILLIAEYSIYYIATRIGVFVDDCRGTEITCDASGISGKSIPTDWSSGTGITVGDPNTSTLYFNYPGATYHYVAIE